MHREPGNRFPVLPRARRRCAARQALWDGYSVAERRECWDFYKCHPFSESKIDWRESAHIFYPIVLRLIIVKFDVDGMV